MTTTPLLQPVPVNLFVTKLVCSGLYTKLKLYHKRIAVLDPRAEVPT